jgi:ribosome-associated heat shock protein Hsp15
MLENDEGKIRLDKWLWAARFFKTRSQATAAVNGGKVSVNGSRVKPSREVRLGDELHIRQGSSEKTVHVRGLSEHRGPAPQAQALYEETPESIAAREKEKELHQLAAAQRPRGEGRPTKRERRQIHRFVGK